MKFNNLIAAILFCIIIFLYSTLVYLSHQHAANGWLNSFYLASGIIAPLMIIFALVYIGLNIFGYKYNKIHDLYLDLVTEMNVIINSCKVTCNTDKALKDNLTLTTIERKSLKAVIDARLENLNPAIKAIEKLNPILESIIGSNQISTEINQFYLHENLLFLAVVGKNDISREETLEKINREIPGFTEKLETIRNKITNKLR